MNAAVGEIKKLNESLSQLRQENIVLKVGLKLFLFLVPSKSVILAPCNFEEPKKASSNIGSWSIHAPKSTLM